MIDLETKLTQLPDEPGVYLMKDALDNIIYVGKAKSLKKRVRQYFGSYRNSSIKVNSMVKQIHDFEYIIVKNEVESLILESNLIKEKTPKYNILLRDDKQYPYIKVNFKEKFPRIQKTRRVIKDGSKYFGPYPSAEAVNKSLDIFNSIFPIRTCNLNLEKNTGKFRPCLNYFIGKCLGPCQGNILEEDYLIMINEIVDFLEGKDDKIIKILEEKMETASKNLEFESAAIFRDDINSLNLLLEKQLMSNTSSSNNSDIVAMARGIDEVCIQIFFIREGKIVGREHFLIDDIYKEEEGEILTAFFKQFYNNSAFIPREIISEIEIKDRDLIEEWLSEKNGMKVNITVPQKGEKKDLVRMVKKNALDMLQKYSSQFVKKQKDNITALEEIKNILNLESTPLRIEAYDISNISGVESVGSMVVFEKGFSKKSDYRKFRIKSVIGPDDYGSINEVLSRRFLRGINEKKESSITSFSYFPDLIMIDGGKGQVNAALKALDKLGIIIPVCGLVKDDFHKTRGIIYNNTEHILPVDSRGFKLIYKIQEEAHRFAINYHRSLRQKKVFKSELDEIPNIGSVRKKNLMSHFKSIDKIKKASIEDLLKVKGMNKAASKSLYNHFHGGE